MQIDSVAISLSILVSSFFGSWHCAGMCGPIASILANRNQLSQYHLARLFAYVSFGVIAGYLGSFFLTNDFIQVRIIAALVFGFMLIWMGVKTWNPNILNKLGSHKPNFFNSFIRKIQAFKINQPGWIIGLLTVVLPCGWLYTYLLAAVASKSALAGSLIMLLFFLGGLPALIAMPWVVKNSINRANSKNKKFAGIVLIIAGIYSLVSFFAGHN